MNQKAIISRRGVVNVLEGDGDYEYANHLYPNRFLWNEENPRLVFGAYESRSFYLPLAQREQAVPARWDWSEDYRCRYESDTFLTGTTTRVEKTGVIVVNWTQATRMCGFGEGRFIGLAMWSEGDDYPKEVVYAGICWNPNYHGGIPSEEFCLAEFWKEAGVAAFQGRKMPCKLAFAADGMSMRDDDT
jgi:hypothetical protein